MKLGIMQPYFLPYLGYWQLMNAVDTYVVYDDVNYINRGRINRNNILINNEAKLINIILIGASQNKHINDILVDGSEINQRKLISKIRLSYSKAPFYKDVIPIIEDIIMQNECNLAKFLLYSFKKISGYLGMTTSLILSSELNKDVSLKGKDKILDICKRLNADTYYNSIGGMELYDKEEFAQNGIELVFLKMDSDIEYKQFNDNFVPNLSILDVLMFNSKEECRHLLERYTLV